MLKLESIENEPDVVDLEAEQFPSMNDLSRLQSAVPEQVEPVEQFEPLTPERKRPVSPKEPPKAISISSGEESEVKVNVNINDMA